MVDRDKDRKSSPLTQGLSLALYGVFVYLIFHPERVAEWDREFHSLYNRASYGLSVWSAIWSIRTLPETDANQQ